MASRARSSVQPCSSSSSNTRERRIRRSNQKVNFSCRPFLFFSNIRQHIQLAVAWEKSPAVARQGSFVRLHYVVVVVVVVSFPALASFRLRLRRSTCPAWPANNAFFFPPPHQITQFKSPILLFFHFFERFGCCCCCLAIKHIYIYIYVRTQVVVFE